MPLKDASIRALRAKERPFREFDGLGLYIEVSPQGSKLWRLKFRMGGKEKRLALGAYPEVSLVMARKLRDEARGQLAQGVDPCRERKLRKATASCGHDDSFNAVAREYIAKRRQEGIADATLKKHEWFLSHLKPAVGAMSVAQVDHQMLLAVLKKLEAKGTHETAKKVRSFASRVFRYAVATGRASSDPAALLEGALISPKPKHHAAILDEKKLGELLRAIDAYHGSFVTRFALQILPHVFVRPGELRLADWSEFDLDAAVWKIPSDRMKARIPHVVPLSPQVLSLLHQLHELTGPSGYVFPALYTSRRPMCENTLNVALRRMGFGQDEMTSHGFRATASTLLNESGHWSPDAIEKALAHGLGNSLRQTYHRGQHWDERVKMATWWSRFLEALKAERC